MTTKLIKMIASISLGGGLLVSLPLTTTSCSCSNKSQNKLLIDITLDPINANFGSEITPTTSLSGHIKTDTGDSVTNVTFTCEGLTEKTGLTINQTTGVISGTLTKKPSNPKFRIKFTADVDGKSLVGYTNDFTITVNPTKLVCDSSTIPGNITGNINTQITATASLSGHIKTDTGDSVTGVVFTCDGLTEKTGLAINQTTGVISGTLTKKPSNPEFKIKFTANVSGKSLVGYTNTFNITVNPTKLVCDKALDAISVNLDSKITPTIDISGLIKTDTGESVKNEVDDLKFSSNNLPTGLSINQSTGVISGTTTRIQESKSSTISFSCTFHGISLQGSTQINIEVNGPQSIVCSEIEDQSIVVNTSFSLGVSDLKMVFDGGVQKSISSSDIASYELVDKDGKSAASTLPQGLTFSTSQGKISGTVTSLNYYAPQTYKIKITGSARIGSKVGYSNTFTLSMENNPLPETVYNIENNVLKGFKDGIDLTQYKDACNTMQIPANVTSVSESAFYPNRQSSIPSFIKNLTFAKNSNCSTIGGYYSFVGATSLTSVDLSNCTKLSYIGEGTFQMCYGIISVTFPSSLTTIYSYAFYQCKSLNSITWNSWNSSASVESTAFSYSLPSEGTVLVTNPIGSNDSAALLAFLKSKGLPEGWTVANIIA